MSTQERPREQLRQENPRDLALSEVPPPVPPESNSPQEEEGAFEARVKTYADEALRQIAGRMHPGEFGRWILRQAKQAENRKALSEALGSPEVFDAVKDCILYRLNEALRAQDGAGIRHWLLDFAKGDYPRMSDLLIDTEVSSALKGVYLMELRNSKKTPTNSDSYLSIGLSSFKKLFAISVSAEEEADARISAEMSRDPSRNPDTQTSPPQPPSLAKKIKSFFGF